MPTNYEIIQAHYEAGKRGDLEGMLAPVAPDCVWIEMAGYPYPGTFHGIAEVIKNVFEPIAAEWEGWRFTLDELLDAGDVIVAVGTYSGTNKATGKPMTARVIHLWRLRDGKVVQFEQFADTRKLADAMVP